MRFAAILFPLYEQLRTASPLLHVGPPFDAWLVFDYQSVKQVLHDHDTFSSSVPARATGSSFPIRRGTRARGLIMKAFVPRVVANLEPHSPAFAVASRCPD